MANTTKIEWADKTWSPWQGCTQVGPGCDHCYAKAMLDTRLHKVKWGAGEPRVHTKNWDSPRRWNKEAAASGCNVTVFPSLCDPFDNEVPDEWRVRFFNLIRDTPHLTWLLLTKRIGNASAMIVDAIYRMGEIEFAWKPWPNLWIGATIVNQQEADRDIPKLLLTPAAGRFISCEPMLGAVDLQRMPLPIYDPTSTSKNPMYMLHLNALTNTPSGHPFISNNGKRGIDWVIAGGESGSEARPAHPDWFRSLRDQCEAAGTPYLFKQWGEWFEVAHGTVDDEGNHIQLDPDHPDDAAYFERGDCVMTVDGRVFTSIDDLPEETLCRHLTKLGKKAAGRLLDGKEHLEFPAALAPRTATEKSHT